MTTIAIIITFSGVSWDAASPVEVVDVGPLLDAESRLREKGTGAEVTPLDDAAA